MKKTSAQIADEVLEKTAINPFIVGSLSHILSNLAVKGGHKTRFLTNLREKALSKGLQRGISGDPQSVGSLTRQLLLGPETVSPEYTGKFMGTLLRDKTKGQQIRALKKLRKAVAMSPTMRGAPELENMVGGVNRVLQKGVPNVGPVRAEGIARRAVPYAAIPLALVTGEPGALGHLAVNRLRLAIAESKPGQRFMENTLYKGLGETGGGAGAKAVRRGIEAAGGSPQNADMVIEQAKRHLMTPEITQREISRGMRAARQLGVPPEMMGPAQKAYEGAGRATEMLTAKPDLQNALVRGMTEGAEVLPERPIRNALWDTFISPSALDTERIGRSMGTAMQTPEGTQELRRLSGAVHGLIGNKNVMRAMRAAGQQPGRPDPMAMLQDFFSARSTPLSPK